MTHNIYIKGIAEPDYRSASYLVTDEDGNTIAEGHKESVAALRIPSTKASFCMELYAASSALYRCEEGSEVHIFTNNQTIASWLTKMEPQKGDYTDYWNMLATIAVKKHFSSLTAEWVKKGTCPQIDALIAKAINR